MENNRVKKRDGELSVKIVVEVAKKKKGKFMYYTMSIIK